MRSTSRCVPPRPPRTRSSWSDRPLAASGPTHVRRGRSAHRSPTAQMTGGAERLTTRARGEAPLPERVQSYWLSHSVVLVLRIEGSQDSTGSCSRPHDTRPVLHLGLTYTVPVAPFAPTPPVSPALLHQLGRGAFLRPRLMRPMPDEPVGRQTTGLRLPRYSCPREGDRPVALSQSWKRMPPLALDGSACHRRPDGHHVAPSSAQGQLPITNCWARNQGQSRCRIAKPETSHNAEQQTRDSHDAGSQNPGPPHAGRPRIHMSLDRTRPQPIKALGSQSSRLSDSPRAWCSSHTGWTIFTPEDLVICQRQVSVSQTPTPSLYSRMCSKTLAPIFWETS